MRLALACAGLCGALAGCAGETVYLRNMAGQNIQCGPYKAGFEAETSLAAQAQLRDCVADYQRQGYERIPRP